jgi:hypothetical protein
MALMKTTVVLLLCALLMLSCADDTLDQSDSRPPVLERHFHLETGEAIAEKSFSYDNNGNLVREHYKALTPKVQSYENIYEYDAHHNRILTLHRLMGETESVSLARYIYDGDKKIEEQYYGSDVTARRPHTKVMYYYNGSRADSSVIRQVLYNMNDYGFGGASYFKYDTEGRLIEEQRRSFNGDVWVASLNSYNGELLNETCNPVTGEEGVFNCTRYEYNTEKKVIRKYATLTGTVDQLLEEHSYAEGLLKESKIFKQKYYLPAYNADPTPYTLQIIYEY